MSGRLLVLGDVHGAHRALRQVFERASFDYENDRLIFLGDVADGWPETRQCIDELLKVKNLVYVLGNHDEWFREWARDTMRQPQQLWYQQGGRATVESYTNNATGAREVPYKHRQFLDSGKDYHVEGERCFVHGGLPDGKHPMACSGYDMRWEREFWHNAWLASMDSGQLSDFQEVCIGHTTTERDSLEPMQRCEVWNVDQGAGWGGKLTLMDVETKEFWQSDIVKELYPEHGGRFAA